MMQTVRPLRVGAAALAAALLVIGCSSEDSSNEPAGGDDIDAEVTTTTTLGGVLTATADVLAGQCFNQVPDPVQQPFAVFLVQCDEAHEFEAYSKTQIELGEPQPAGAPYPGSLEVANAAEAQCITGFSSFIGTSWETSEFDVQTWWPTEASWNTVNDRTIMCAVYPVRGGVTFGTARESRR
ncbi:MAG: hypothetical protein GX868_07285 [Actinobacteria bacterium]|nr:hypothetical protein [Actinomycetota bacterium]